MNQCVPSWDVDDTISTATKFPLLPNSNSIVAPQVPMLDYQVAELVCKNGELSSWGKPPTKDTLESIVNQQIGEDNHKNKLFSWSDPHPSMMPIDALVPSFFEKDQRMYQGFSADVASCGGIATQGDVSKRASVMARVPVAHELSFCKDLSASGSATCQRNLSVGFNSACMGSPENTTSSGKQCTRTTVNDDQDSTRHHRSQCEAGDEDSKTVRIDTSYGSNKKNKAAAVHNQSERRRRDKINQKLKTLQKLVPYSSKTDKASMLDEVIQYMKQLQAHVQMMNWMKMYSSMMLPITMQQQQLKMSMMAHMGMGMGKNIGMGIGMGMDMNTINIPGIPPVFPPTPFMPMASWNACGGDGLQGAQSKDAYNRMAALYHHQLFHPPPSNSKS